MSLLAFNPSLCHLLVFCCCLKAKSLVGIEPYKRAFDLLNSSSEIKGGPLSGFMKKMVHRLGPRRWSTDQGSLF